MEIMIILISTVYTGKTCIHSIKYILTNEIDNKIGGL